jgi:hypothetical protein
MLSAIMLSVIMPSLIMPSLILLSVIMLSVIRLSVIKLIDMAPSKKDSSFFCNVSDEVKTLKRRTSDEPVSTSRIGFFGDEVIESGVDNKARIARDQCYKTFYNHKLRITS